MKVLAIVICVKNGADFLQDQLNSIANQTWKRFDIYIKDNNSQDESLKIINEFKSENPIINIIECKGDDDHFANSYIRLVQEIIGKYDYYAFCDQDDIWLANHLERGINFIKSNKDGLAYLFCSRTKLVDSKGKVIGSSIYFKNKPSFKNALVQSIAGANTMIFNNKAAQLLIDIKTKSKIISHDWLLYQLVSGSNGYIKYSKDASVLYRQHSKNLIGSNTGFKNKIKRFKMVLAGQIHEYNRSTLEHLSDFNHLSEPNLLTLKNFKESLNGSIFKRIFYIIKSGIYRQTIAGQFMLIVNIFVKSGK